MLKCIGIIMLLFAGIVLALGNGGSVTSEKITVPKPKKVENHG